ncbi:uncharacterized protein LOC108456369 [Gossypium arboreum]|nr:uncharacterized protein LOC108456369 [Gossypium arboreum]
MEDNKETLKSSLEILILSYLHIVLIKAIREINKPLLLKGKQHKHLSDTSWKRYMEMENDSVQKSLVWLHAVLQSKIGHGLEATVLQGLQITHAEKGLMRFDFVVPNAVSDVDGNWHVGALATMLDLIGPVTTFSFANRVISTVDFNVSYYSTAKIQEHVEVESKVIANRGNLIHVVVEVRRKGNGEVIAVGKLWMASDKRTVAEVSNARQL